MRRTQFLAVIVAWASLFGLAPAVAGAATPQEPRLRPPVYGSGIHGDGLRNFADPSIVPYNGRYYAYSTHQTGAFARQISVMSSPNLWDWNAPAQAPVDAMPTTPAWARSLNNGGAFWAPSVVRAGGQFVMYFAARHKNVSSSTPGWCIGIATSGNPAGPFHPRSTPFFCRVASNGNTPAGFSATPGADKGAIDPQVFRAPNGSLFLYFKALDNLRQLWGVRLSANGLQHVGPGYGFAPLESQANTWEYSTRLHFTVMENPGMVFNPTPGVNRPYVLLYAGGEWQVPGNYGTGYVACETPLSGCVRLTTDRPWLTSRGANAGPGGASAFIGPGGQPWIAYHTYEAGQIMNGNGRRLHLEPLRFVAGKPRLDSRRPTGTIDGDSPGAGQVHLEGTADDPDTGREVVVRLRKDTQSGPLVDTVTTNPGGNWVFNDDVAAGPHRYCGMAVDDNGLSDKLLGCRDIVVT